MNEEERGEDEVVIHRDIIVLGASAGGVETLGEIMRNLPADLPAALFVVLHVAPHSPSVLPAILSRRGPLPAHVPQDGERIGLGRIYVAPPDHHLLIGDGIVRVTRGPSENGHRPAIDPLFRSAARAVRQRVIAVILSGMLDDGTAGAVVVKQQGGIVIVQDPDDALFNGMPNSAIENVSVDYVAPVREIGALLTRLVREPVRIQNQSIREKDKAMEEDSLSESQEVSLKLEVGAALMEPGMTDVEQRPGASPSVYSCPECGGVLWEVEKDDLLRFRCRTGHAYSADSLLAEQTESLEDALWTALRALEESGSLSRRLLERARKRGHNLVATRFAQQAEEAATRAATIRQALLQGGVFQGTEPSASPTATLADRSEVR